MEEDKDLTKPVEIPTKKVKGHTSKRLENVDLDYLDKMAKTVLYREINHLLDLSHKGKLDRDESLALTGYLKAIKELKKTADEDLEGMTDEELAAIANKK